MTRQELAKKLGWTIARLDKEFPPYEALIISAIPEPQDEMAVWIANVPGVTMSGYMLAFAKNRKEAARLINQDRKIVIPNAKRDEDVLEADLIRLPIMQPGTYLIWDGDY